MSGAWDAHHGALDAPVRYGSTVTYELAARWVRAQATVEDWGCGGGGLSEWVRPERYVGVDSSASPFASVRAELATYDTAPDAIVLRHVLEHNDDWEEILANALHSFQERLCLIVFTPLVASTRVLHHEPDFGDVPVIVFALQDLYGAFFDAGVHVFHETLTLPDALYGSETVFYAQR